MLTGRVLITGGAGFLGRGILRRAQQEKWPAEFTVFSRDELKQDLCRQKYPTARYVLGDIRDFEPLRNAMVGHDIVIHTAAMKYIPEAEHNVSECVSINVGGSSNVIRAARDARVGRVLGVSTDKAVNPINTYGMTKAIMERMFAAANLGWGPEYVCCRYGNVIGSSGSVIPKFKQQLVDLGYVRITDPEMTRYWMSIGEAIDTILFALEPDRIPGSITIPSPKAMQLYDLACAIVNKGEIRVMGPRPGEKKHEQLMGAEESIWAIRHDGFYEILPLQARDKPISDPFVLMSNEPDRWMYGKELKTYSCDAEAV